MNPPCAKCNKIVYPVEKLSCLDKIWHKGCFKCTSCEMTLNMKNYKGYNKLPYCTAHYPTTKFTSVSDTPESRRIAQNTQNISQIVYHKQFNDERTKNQPGVDNTEDDHPVKAPSNNKKITEIGIPHPGGVAPNFGGGPPRVTKNAPQTTVVEPSPPVPTPYAQPPQLPSPQSHVEPPVPQVPPQKARYVAQFDYDAADDDEVSFVEGDVIEDGQVIDEGWMTGTVQRTGHSGLLPANYVYQA